MATKLAYAEFKMPQKIDNNTVTAVSEVQYGPILLDGFCVYIGKRGFPLSDLRTWILADKEPAVKCPNCKEEFEDNRALGAHRWFKHNIKGERQK